MTLADAIIEAQKLSHAVPSLLAWDMVYKSNFHLGDTELADVEVKLWSTRRRLATEGHVQKRIFNLEDYVWKQYRAAGLKQQLEESIELERRKRNGSR